MGCPLSLSEHESCYVKEFLLIFCHVPRSLSEDVPLCGLCPSLGLEGPEEEKSWEEHQEQLEKEMQEARRMVFHLQVSHKAKGDRFRPEEDQLQTSPSNTYIKINDLDWTLI